MSKYYSVILLALIAIVESHKSYILKDQPWKAELKKCWSGGDEHRDYYFTIGSLATLGLPYEDINKNTVVEAAGTFELYTKATGQLSYTKLVLHNYEEKPNTKSFSAAYHAAGNIGWGSQLVDIVLTVKFQNNNDIILSNWVYAGSWYSISCASGKSYVDQIEIVD